MFSSSSSCHATRDEDEDVDDADDADDDDGGDDDDDDERERERDDADDDHDDDGGGDDDDERERERESTKHASPSESWTPSEQMVGGVTLHMSRHHTPYICHIIIHIGMKNTSDGRGRDLTCHYVTSSYT